MLSRRRILSTVAAFAVVALPVAGSTIPGAEAAPPPGSPAARHGLGFDVEAARAFHDNLPSGRRVVGKPMRLRTVSVAPSAYSLKSFAQPVGDQGNVGSCVAWATGYTAMGLLANEQGIDGDPFAPMYVYSQIAKGVDNGTYASVALPIEKAQGIDTKADYWQGDFDYTTQPTPAERANAYHYRVSGFTDLTNVVDRKTAIKDAISSGLPVPIGAVVRTSFRYLNDANYTYAPTRGERALGGHEITIIGYDENYVELQNSWGTDWGHDGFFRAPWSWVLGKDVNEIHSVGKLVS